MVGVWDQLGASSELWGGSSARFWALHPSPHFLLPGAGGGDPLTHADFLIRAQISSSLCFRQAGWLPLHFLANHDSDLPRGEEAALGEAGRVPLHFHYSVPSAHFRNP